MPGDMTATLFRRISVRLLCTSLGIAVIWLLLMLLYLSNFFRSSSKTQQNLDKLRINQFEMTSSLESQLLFHQMRAHLNSSLSTYGESVGLQPNLKLGDQQTVSPLLKTASIQAGLDSPLQLASRNPSSSATSTYDDKKNRKHRYGRKLRKRIGAHHTENPGESLRVGALLNAVGSWSPPVDHHAVLDTPPPQHNGHWSKGISSHPKEAVGQKPAVTSHLHSPTNIESSKQEQQFEVKLEQHGDWLYLPSIASKDSALDLQQGFDRHSMNISLSNRIPLNRQIRDYRPPKCRSLSFHNISKRLTVSVVICFHNEALSMLLRTVISVINTVPPARLQEIILVDDSSTFDYLGGILDQLVLPLSQVRLIRTQKREGLIRARMLGVSMAKGQILVFLDSHCECNPGWLDPLLQILATNKHTVVVPDLDVIDPDSLSYTAAPGNVHGSFTWNLTFVWKSLFQQIPSELTHLPIKSPTMIGGVFAIWKEYFLRLGGYDVGLDIWGGENIQLSFKVWMCGGSIQIIPCSRVGHVFRRVIPYGFPAGGHATIQKNAMRVAEAMLADHKRYFYASQNISQNPGVYRSLEPERTHMKKLHCQDFSWYLKHVIPELPVPNMNTLYYGQLWNVGSKDCLQTNRSIKLPLQLFPCKTQHPTQMIMLSTSGQLQHKSRCITVSSKAELQLKPCSHTKAVWTLTKDGQLRVSRGLHKEKEVTPSGGLAGWSHCLTLSPESRRVIVTSCHLPLHISQQWQFNIHFDRRRLVMSYL